MPEYVAPGVYGEELGPGPKPIAGVTTSVAGFLGRTERGPQDVRDISSWLEYQWWYGGHLGADQSVMSYAVQGFFDNGGTRCFVGRVVRKNAARAELTAGPVRVRAIGRGSWGGRVFVKFLPATNAQSGGAGDPARSWIRLRVYYFATVTPGVTPIDPDDGNLPPDPSRRPDVIEDFDNASLDPRSVNSLITAVNAGSHLVRITLVGAPADALPLEDTITSLAGADATDAPPELDDYSGDLDPLESIELADAALFGRGRGLAALEAVDRVSLLVAPDQAHPDLSFAAELGSALVASCERLQDRFAILSAERDFFKKVGGGAARPPLDTSYGAFYYPWIEIYDPHTRGDVLIPPSGHIAGIVARTDTEQGVHKAPANAVVVGAKGLQVPVTKADQDLLNPVGVNCLRDFRADGRGIRLWGARTMSSDPEWKYVNVRRQFLFIEESIEEGTQWVVFEPNAPATWSQVQRAVSAFLITVWRSSALVGTTPDQAFFVRCDRTTMTQDDIDSGRLICTIGVAPLSPAEFIIFRIGQITADAPT